MECKQFRGIILVFLGMIMSAAVAASPTEWQTLEPGLEYTRIGNFPDHPNGYLQAFRIDLKNYDLKLAFTQKDNLMFYTFAELMEVSKAIIAVNGGFFTPDLKPLGLRITQGKKMNPLRDISWWGVFFLQGNQAHIFSKEEFKHYPEHSKINFAIQAGPRLITHGVIPSLKPSIDARTALGVTQDGRVILLATENVLLSMTDLADIMHKSAEAGGLECIDAINLDGGGSTQLYTRLKNLLLEIPGYSQVVDVVLVVPKDRELG